MPDALPPARGKLRGSRAPCHTKRVFKLDRRSSAKPRKRKGRRLRRVPCPTTRALPDKRKKICRAAGPPHRTSNHHCSLRSIGAAPMTQLRRHDMGRPRRDRASQVYILFRTIAQVSPCSAFVTVAEIEFRPDELVATVPPSMDSILTKGLDWRCARWPIAGRLVHRQS